MHGAIYSRNAARVDGRLLNRALQRAAEGHGLVVRSGSVERLVVQDQAVTGAVVDGESLRAGHVAIAGGAWSQTFAAQLGVDIPSPRSAGRSFTSVSTARTLASGPW